VFVDLNNIGQNTRWQEVARLVYVAITRASDKIHVFGELCMNYNKQPPVNLMEGFVDVQAL
jgi:ATP-dependent exoDNAse (exonuclease V) beta subunit